ncbi:MAG: cupin domain-containing protein [Pseudonocardiales bacterium]|nr:cupin domain-containing protein [Pseudonocardiales bacterium]
MVRIRRGLAAGALAVALLGAVAGCAQPGQLGQEEPTTAPPPPPAPATPEIPQLLGVGLVDYPVSVQTPGPATFSVRTLVVPPGGTTGWHAHPGTETSVVTRGTLTVLIQDGCEPRRFAAGDAIFVADAVPHLARNDGDVAVELVTTYLLAPGLPDRFEVPPACPAG